MDDTLKKIITIIATALVSILGVLGVQIAVGYPAETVVETKIVESGGLELSEDQIPATIEGDLGETIDLENIPTVESVDGGLFEDELTGLSLADGEYADLGAIEAVNTSSVEAFVNDVLGRCVIANNYYGAQCVSLARAFWWSYANRDVITCGTGLAKGMMNCADDNAGDDFQTIWSADEIIAGTWIVTGGSYTGHVCMALGPAVNGYVACLGENQGGRSCGIGVGGSAANIVNLSVKNFIGGYIPKTYIPEPEPEPTEDTCKVYEVQAGDTLSDIMKRCLGEVDWAKMNDYAKNWYSTKYLLSPTVYDGWTSERGYGLFAGDIIEFSGD